MNYLAVVAVVLGFLGAIWSAMGKTSFLFDISALVFFLWGLWYLVGAR